MSLREAATRVFSNASGSYSSNVNLAVENSSWSDEQQLQEMYLKRKSFRLQLRQVCRAAPSRAHCPLCPKDHFRRSCIQTMYSQAVCSMSYMIGLGQHSSPKSHSPCRVKRA